MAQYPFYTHKSIPSGCVGQTDRQGSFFTRQLQKFTCDVGLIRKEFGIFTSRFQILPRIPRLFFDLVARIL